MTDYRYRAFISYSHADAAAARWLHRALERYRPPPDVVERLPAARRRLAPVFLDRDELQAAGSIDRTLTAALDDSEALIVVCSPAAARSRWVNEEVAYFKRMGRDRLVLCVLVGGAASDPQDTFPRSCLFDVDASGELDAQAPLEPLAADMRRKGDGRGRALLKLAATMLEVRFDNLVQRESARRQRRLAAIAIAAVAGMVLTAGLALFALVQRNEAQAQRQIAQGEAATLAQTVNFLVEIFQVSNPATENPRDITALQILERGARRLATEDAGRPQIRGRLMSTIGDVYFNLGLFARGRTELENALRLLAPASLAALETRIALANSLVALGDFKGAQAHYAAVDAALAQHFPAELAVRGRAQRWWGNMELTRNDHDAALAHYHRAIDFYARSGSDPMGLARSQITLANVLMDKDTSGLQEADRLIAAAIAGLDASVGPRHADTVVARNALGVLRLRQGRLGAAIATLQRVERDEVRLFGADHLSVGKTQFQLGSALLLAGRAAEAATVLRRSLRVAMASSGAGSAPHALAALTLASALARKGNAAAEARGLVAGADQALHKQFGAASPYRLNVLLGQADVATAYGPAADRAAICAEAVRVVAGDAALAGLWRQDFRESCPRF